MDNETEREIANLKSHLETIMAGNAAVYQQKYNAQREALIVALAANDKRLDAMNEFRASLTDQSNRMLTRQEYELGKITVSDKVEQIRSTWESRFEAEMKPLNERVADIGKPQWTLIGSLISILLVMIAGVWLVIGLKIDDALSPIAVNLEQVKATVIADSTRLLALEGITSNSTQADASSRGDRAQLNDRLRILESLVTVRSGQSDAKYAVIATQLTEIETQFCGSDVVRNLMHANDLRLFAMLWHKVFAGSDIPTDNAFYPQVCNRQIQIGRGG